MNKILLFSFLIYSSTLFSQVGIGTITPNAALDVTSTDDGILVPRIALVNTTTATVVTPTTSEIVYNTATINDVTPGFYYWNGTIWVRILTGANDDWKTTGNSGTNAATNFIGTTDAVDFVTKTNNTEKVRITTTGAVGIGTSTPQGALDVVAGSNNYGFVIPRVALTASNAQAPVTNPQTGVIPAGTIVYNTATAGTAPNNVAPGLYFWNGTRWIAFAGAPGGLDWSLTGNTSTTPGTYAAPGTDYLGTSDNTALHITTVGQPRMRITTNGNVGIGQSSLSTVRVGITPIATTDTALYATGTGSSSTALIATGRFENTAADYATSITSSTPSVPTAGSPNIAIRAASGNASFVAPTGNTNIGVASNATNIAFYGVTEGTTDANRRAAEFRTNDAGASTNADANDPIAYLAGYGNNVNVDGTNTRSLKYGGYFYGGNASAYAYVGVRLGAAITGNSNFKIIGPGTVSTIVASDKVNDTKKIMFAPEAPEVLFEDYGTGELVDGEATIKIDPIFARNIYVDKKHPLKVFIQLEGDCNGVYVTNKSKEGFTVKELAGGKSNVSFSWHIVGNRADETEANGEKTIYQSLRFPEAPKAIKPTASESKKLQQIKADTDSEIKNNDDVNPN